MHISRISVAVRIIGICVITICILAAAIFIHDRDLIHVKSHDYPHANKELFSAKTNQNLLGEPYYIEIDQIVSYSREDLIINTEYGSLFLHSDDNHSSAFYQQIPSNMSNMIVVYFVCDGWDRLHNMPRGLFLGARDAEDNGTIVPGYSAAKIEFEGKTLAPITPTPGQTEN